MRAFRVSPREASVIACVALVLLLVAVIRPGAGSTPVPERSIVNDNSPLVNPLFQTSPNAPPPSPGLQVGRTACDYQHNMSAGYQIGRAPGTDVVHMCWMQMDGAPGQFDDDRFVSYNSYTISTGTLNHGPHGIKLGSWENRAGYPNLAVDDSNGAHVALHQRPEEWAPYTSWRAYFPMPGSGLHADDELTSTPLFGEVLWPRVEVERSGGGSGVCHMLAHGANGDPAERIVYWRFNGATWDGPVAIDSNDRLSYVIAADPNSDKVAIVITTDREPQFNGMRNIAYYESQTEGVGWISGAELGDHNKQFITDYTDPSGPEAWGHVSTAYDYAGVLHVIWDEQLIADSSHDAAICHWSDARLTIRTVAQSGWPHVARSGLFALHLAKMTLGIGDGATPCQGGVEPNTNYLYVVYTQFGGPTPGEQADRSAAGYYNGELHLAVSREGGIPGHDRKT